MAMPFIENLAETLLGTPRIFTKFVELEGNLGEPEQVGYVLVKSNHSGLHVSMELWNGDEGKTLETAITVEELGKLSKIFNEAHTLAKARVSA